ncbi:MAG: hypothetical protein EGR93_00040 [Prevotella sp.]|nr:hypothetical protein [Prevotella sp.]
MTRVIWKKQHVILKNWRKLNVENAKAKEEALASINQAFTELKLHREGKMDFIPAEDLLNEL